MSGVYNGPSCQPNLEPIAAGKRCTGECCKAFSLPWSHERMAEFWRNEKRPVTEDYSEVAMILAMVVPHPDGKRYTCRLFDGKNCTAYEARPEMCSSYPYGRRCEHGKLCAWRDGRLGRNDRSEDARLHLPVTP